MTLTREVLFDLFFIVVCIYFVVLACTIKYLNGKWKKINEILYILLSIILAFFAFYEGNTKKIIRRIFVIVNSILYLFIVKDRANGKND